MRFAVCNPAASTAPRQSYAAMILFFLSAERELSVASSTSHAQHKNESNKRQRDHSVYICF